MLHIRDVKFPFRGVFIYFFPPLHYINWAELLVFKTSFKHVCRCYQFSYQLFLINIYSIRAVLKSKTGPLRIGRRRSIADVPSSKSKTNDVMPKRLYVKEMFTTVCWSCCLDLDLNPLNLIQEHPLLTHAQWFEHCSYWRRIKMNL